MRVWNRESSVEWKVRNMFPALCSILLFCSACAEPTTQRPTFTASEIESERNEQLKYTHNAQRTKYDEITYSSAQLKEMESRLRGILTQLTPEAIRLCRDLNGPKANCNMNVELSAKGKGLNAYADGRKIVIYPAMVDFAESDTHLAMVIAHEYTHHMMQHVQHSQRNVLGGALLGTLADALAASQGVNTQGQFGKVGANAALLTYSPDFEQEADYIALYILARSGYSIEEAPNFWREMARNNPQGIYNRTTHPTTPERFILLSKTIDEIKAKEAANQPLNPNLLPNE